MTELLQVFEYVQCAQSVSHPERYRLPHGLPAYFSAGAAFFYSEEESLAIAEFVAGELFIARTARCCPAALLLEPIAFLSLRRPFPFALGGRHTRRNGCRTLY